MATSCEDVSARMMELLYGELPEGERAAIEAHLGQIGQAGSDRAGCARCRAELADLQKTQAVARQVLDETPPARAHQAILRAAAAAVAARAPVPERRAVPTRASFWDRLRSRWTLPTLATVGAVAVFLLASKIFLEPDKTYERGRQGLVPPPAEAPASAPAAQEPATPPPIEAQAPATRAAPEPSGATGGKRPSGRTKDEVGGELGNLGTIDAPAANQRRAVPEAHAKAKREAAPLEELAPPHPARADRAERADRSFAAPPPPRTVQPAQAGPADDEIVGLDRNDSEKSRQSEGRGAGMGGAVNKSLGPKAPAPAKAAKKGFGGLDDDFDGRAAGSAESAPTGSLAQEAAPRDKSARSASAPAPAPPPTRAPMPAKRDLSDKTSASDEASEASASEDDEAPAARSRSVRRAEAPVARDQTAPKAETPVARADRLFSQGRWTEAAAAYRELIGRDPRNADVGRWRKRLAACQAALAPFAAPPP